MKIKLSIQAVAAKQLESAIWMYASNFDEVAVHTIAGAAFEIYTKRLRLVNFKSSMQQVLKPERYKEFIDLWNKPYNFFKHGEYKKNPIDEYIYEDESVDFLLYFACEANIAGDEKYRLRSALVFKNYFIIKNPSLLEPKIFNDTYKKNADDNGLSLEDLKKKETLLKMLKLLDSTFIN